MEWVIGGSIIFVGIAVGAMIAVTRWAERDIKRQMDRLIFPFYHQNRELRLRNKQLRAELGIDDDEELYG